jgi:hypothetical protein
MLTALIALGIFGTTLLLVHGLAAGYRLLAPRGSDRAVERLQQWMAPKGDATLDIVRKDTMSEIPWLDEFLKTSQRLQPFRKLHLQSDCQIPLGMVTLTTPARIYCVDRCHGVWSGSLRLSFLAQEASDGHVGAAIA